MRSGSTIVPSDQGALASLQIFDVDGGHAPRKKCMVRWTRCSSPTAILEKGSQAIGSLPGVRSLIRRLGALVHALCDAGMILYVEHHSVSMHNLQQP